MLNLPTPVQHSRTIYVILTEQLVSRWFNLYEVLCHCSFKFVPIMYIGRLWCCAIVHSNFVPIVYIGRLSARAKEKMSATELDQNIDFSDLEKKYSVQLDTKVESVAVLRRRNIHGREAQVAQTWPKLRIENQGQ